MYKPLRHVIFIEEAHNLIAPQSQMENHEDFDPKIAATECIVDILKEVRALREGVIIADQLPTAMADDVIKNTNFKIVHRLTSTDDRSLVGSTMSASELQLEQVATYMPGQALMTYEGLLRPFEMRVQNLENHGETPDDTELYESLQQKLGMRGIWRRYEARRWNELQKKVEAVIALERNECNALAQVDFTGMSAIQREGFLTQCTERYQALMILRQTRLNELESMTSDFFENAEPATMQKVIESIGKTYQAKLYRQIVGQVS